LLEGLGVEHSVRFVDRYVSLDELGRWLEAADAIIGAMDRTIAQKIVTYDFARLMEGATEVKCSEFGDTLIRNL